MGNLLANLSSGHQSHQVTPPGFLYSSYPILSKDDMFQRHHCYRWSDSTIPMRGRLPFWPPTDVPFPSGCLISFLRLSTVHKSYLTPFSPAFFYPEYLRSQTWVTHPMYRYP